MITVYASLVYIRCFYCHGDGEIEIDEPYLYNGQYWRSRRTHKEKCIFCNGTCQTAHIVQDGYEPCSNCFDGTMNPFQHSRNNVILRTFPKDCWQCNGKGTLPKDWDEKRKAVKRNADIFYAMNPWKRR